MAAGLFYRKMAYWILGAVPAGYFFLWSIMFGVAALFNVGNEDLDWDLGKVFFLTWVANFSYVAGIYTLVRIPNIFCNKTKWLLSVFIFAGIAALIFLARDLGIIGYWSDSFFTPIIILVVSLVSILLVAELWLSPNKSLNTDASDAGAGYNGFKFSSLVEK